MQNFEFENPTKIIFGKGCIAKIGEEVARFGDRVMVVYGRGSIKKNGIYDQVMESLQETGRTIVEFGGVKSNPVLSHALMGIDCARTEAVDVILAVGGGSVIDTAKTIAVGACTTLDTDMWDFFMRRQPITVALPIVTVVTISASASEMNPAAVMTKENEAQKFSIRSPHIQPKTSILDPTVLFSLSPAYSAYSAVDVITHMLEGYFNNEEPNSSLQDRLVEGLIDTVMESTRVILSDPADYNARANMMWGAVLAFNGLTTAGMGPISLPAHMIEHSLSAIYDVAHGAGLSIVLPGWMRYTALKTPAKFARLAREIFSVQGDDELQVALDGIECLKTWFSTIGSPISLEEVGIPKRDINSIAQNAHALAQVWGLNDYTVDVIARILTLCVE